MRVQIPEGWDLFQIAERLEAQGICPRTEFERVALANAPESQRSHEGYLYPATYEWRTNSRAEVVVARLHTEANARHEALFNEELAALAEFRATHGLDRAGVITLASIVQKEAADASEFGAIASVFLNRLADPEFRPSRMLQSDPTAGYGCKLPDAPASCAEYEGRITREMLRDPANRYNSYRHPGLPPGPIGSPSVAAIRAVLHAPATTYLFFVSPGGGKHVFSHTLEEHERATKSAK
jgi:UPF0755 protein